MQVNSSHACSCLDIQGILITNETLFECIWASRWRGFDNYQVYESKAPDELMTTSPVIWQQFNGKSFNDTATLTIMSLSMGSANMGLPCHHVHIVGEMIGRMDLHIQTHSWKVWNGVRFSGTFGQKSVRISELRPLYSLKGELCKQNSSRWPYIFVTTIRKASAPFNGLCWQSFPQKLK